MNVRAMLPPTFCKSRFSCGTAHSRPHDGHALALFEQLWSRCSVDGPVDTTPAEHALVGGVHYGGPSPPAQVALLQHQHAPTLNAETKHHTATGERGGTTSILSGRYLKQKSRGREETHRNTRVVSTKHTGARRVGERREAAKQGFVRARVPFSKSP